VLIFDDVLRIVSFYNEEELQNVVNQWRKLEIIELSDTVKALDDTDDFWTALYQLRIAGEYPLRCVSEIGHSVCHILQLIVKEFSQR